MKYEIKRFEVIGVDEFKPHPGVPECEGASAKMDFEMMKMSVKAAGVLVPVVVDAEKRVIDGWLRIRASKAVGITGVPSLVVETDYALAAHAVLNVGSWKNHEVE
jgi:ParB-like chromosome segregation protein Spo0J